MGSHPPPCAKEQWQKNLRGDYHDVSNKWLSFDPTLYHAVEPVTSGQRVSLADIGLFPPFSAQVAEASATADHCPPSLLPSLAAPVSTSVDPDGPEGPTTLTTANER